MATHGKMLLLLIVLCIALPIVALARLKTMLLARTQRALNRRGFQLSVGKFTLIPPCLSSVRLRSSIVDELRISAGTSGSARSLHLLIVCSRPVLHASACKPHVDGRDSPAPIIAEKDSPPESPRASSSRRQSFTGSPTEAKRGDHGSVGRRRAADACVWLLWHACRRVSFYATDCTLKVLDRSIPASSDPTTLAHVHVPRSILSACECSDEHALASWAIDTHSAHVCALSSDNSMHTVCMLSNVTSSGDVGRAEKQLALLSVNVKGSEIKVYAHRALNCFLNTLQTFNKAGIHGGERNHDEDSLSGENKDFSKHKATSSMADTQAHRPTMHFACSTTYITWHDVHSARSLQLSLDGASFDVEGWSGYGSWVLNARCNSVALSPEGEYTSHAAEESSFRMLRMQLYECEQARTLSLQLHQGLLIPSECLITLIEYAVSGKTGSNITMALQLMEQMKRNRPISETNKEKKALSFHFAIEQALEARLHTGHGRSILSTKVEECEGRLGRGNTTVNVSLLHTRVIDPVHLKPQLSLVKGKVLKVWVTQSAPQASRVQIQLQRSSSWLNTETIHHLEAALDSISQLFWSVKKTLSVAKEHFSTSGKPNHIKTAKTGSLILDVDEMAFALHGSASVGAQNGKVAAAGNGDRIYSKLTGVISQVRFKHDQHLRHTTAVATSGEISFKDQLTTSANGVAVGTEREQLLFASDSIRARILDHSSKRGDQKNEEVQLSLNSVEGQYDVDAYLFLQHALKIIRATQIKSLFKATETSGSMKDFAVQNPMDVNVDVGSITIDVALSTVSQLTMHAGHLHLVKSSATAEVGHSEILLNGKQIICWTSCRMRFRPEREGTLKPSDAGQEAGYGRALNWSLEESRRRAGCLLGDMHNPHKRFVVFMEEPTFTLPEAEHIGHLVHDALMLNRRLSICLQSDHHTNELDTTVQTHATDGIAESLCEMVFTFTEGVIQFCDSELEKSLRLREKALDDTSLLRRIGHILSKAQEEAINDEEHDKSLADELNEESIDAAFARSYIHAIEILRSKLGPRLFASAQEGQALIRFPGTSAQVFKALKSAAIETKALDPGCVGEQLEGVCAINIDFVALNTQVVLRDEEPLVKTREVAASGPVINARQKVNVPLDEEQSLWNLGRYRLVEDTKRGGSQKAPPKLYCNWHVTANGVSGTYSARLEPSLSDIVRDIQRLIPKDTLRQQPQEEKLSFWDAIRYFWRGSVSLFSDSLHVRLPCLSSNIERSNRAGTAELVADQCTLKLESDGTVQSHAYYICVSANHSSADGGELKPQPSRNNFGITFVNCSIGMSLFWTTVGGQHPTYHLLKDSETGKQKISLENFRSSQVEVNLKLDAERVDHDDIPQRGKPQVNASAMFNVSEDDIVLMRSILSGLMSPPQPWRKSFERRRFGEAKQKSKKSASIMELTQRVSVQLHINKARYVHPSELENDPATGTQLFAKSLMYVQDFDRRIIKGNFKGDGRLRSVNRNLDVEWIQCVQLAAEDPTTPSIVPEQAILTKHRTKQLSALLNLEVPLEEGNPGEFPEMLSDEDERLVLHIQNLVLRQELESNDEGSNEDTWPYYMHMVADSMRLLWNEGSRDAISTIFVAMRRAFTRPLRFSTYHLCSKHLRHSLDGRSGSDTESTDPLEDPTPPNSHISDDDHIQAKQQVAESSIDTTDDDLLGILMHQSRYPEDETSTGVSSTGSRDGTKDSDEQKSGNHSEKPSLSSIELQNLEPPQSIRSDDNNRTERCLQFVIEVSHLQVNLEAPSQEGRILLAAEAASMQCMTHTLSSEDFHRRILSTHLSRVQAFASPTDVDRHAGVQWLNHSLSPRDKKRSVLMQRVLDRFDLSVHDSQTMSSADNEMYQRHWTIRGAEIEATLDSKHFHVLVDVIAQLLMTAPRVPQENAVDKAQHLLQRHSFTSHGTRNVAESLFDALQSSITGACMASDAITLADAINSGSPFFNYFTCGRDKCADALRKAVQSSLRHEETRVLHSLLDLEERTKNALKEIRENHKTADMCIAVMFDSIRWYMQDYKSTQLENFLLISLGRVSFKQDRQFDNRGRITAKVHTLNIEDQTSSGSGNVLAQWDVGAGSGAGTKDILHITANRRASQSRASTPVYENIGLTLNPLMLDTDEQMLGRLRDYFFPQDPSFAEEEAARQHLGTPNLASPQRAAKGSPNKRVVHRRGHTWDGSFDSRELDAASQAENSTTSSRGGGLRAQYVRFEQVPVVVTYHGHPMSVKEMKLVLDRAVYTDFKGTWRALFKRLTRHVIVSILKSVAGLQGKKLSSLVPSSIGLSNADIESTDQDESKLSRQSHVLSAQKEAQPQLQQHYHHRRGLSAPNFFPFHLRPKNEESDKHESDDKRKAAMLGYSRYGEGKN